MKSSLSAITLILFGFFWLPYFSLNAQTGPGGLSSSDAPTQLWLRADRGISEVNGQIQTWADQSGNGRNFSQSNASQRPTLKASGLNGRPTVDFNAASGTNLAGPNTSVFFGLNANKPTNITDFIIVFQQPVSNTGDVINFPRSSGNTFVALVSNGGDGNPRESNVDDVMTFVRNASGPTFSVASSENSVSNNDGFAAGSFHAVRFGFDPTDGGTNDTQWLYDIDNLVEEITTGLDMTYAGVDGAAAITIGGLGNNTSYDGEIAEIILYSDKLTDIEFIVLQNYLNARYGLTTTNDFYAGDTGGNGNADFGVIGIGQISSGSVNTASQDGLTLTANAGLDNGDYVFAGYTAATSASNAIINNDILLTAGTIVARMKRAWYLDKTDANTALTTDITFNFNNTGTDVPDLSGASVGGYKLLHRAGTTGAWTVVAATASSLSNANKTVTFAAQSITNDGYYAIGTANATSSPLGDIQQTWYSFQSGSWGDPNTWTLDGATTPVFDNKNNEIPGPGDKVILTSGRTVRMYTDNTETTVQNNVTIQSLEVRTSARLRLLTSTGNNLGAVSGAGTISLQGTPNTGATAYLENLPAGDYTKFADQLLGGAIELSSAASGTPLLLNQAYASTNVTTDPNGAVSRTLTINMTLATDVVILQRNLYLNRNLNITQGVHRIHRNNAVTYANDASASANLNMTVIGNTTVATNGSIRTGTSNQRHQLNLYGNLTLNGSAYFTQRTTATTNSDATDGIVDVNFLNQEISQTLACNAVARFYRLEIDKASSAVFLNITASAVANFNLFGRANYSINSDLGVGDTNNNAFGLVTGGVSLGTNVHITTLNTGGNYSISSLATLQIDGGRILKTNGPALVPYGTFRMNSGIAELLVQSGVTLRDAGRIEVNGGELYANAIRTSNEASGDAGSYIQTGGSVVVNGGSGVGSPTTGNTGATGTNTAYYSFTMTLQENVFRMSGGTLTVKRSNYNNSTGGASEDNTDDLGGSIFINSSAANYSVTGGSVVLDMDNGVPAKISSTAPFYNLTLTNTSGSTIADNNGGVTLIQPDDRRIAFISGGQVGTGAGDAIMTDQALVVLNDLIIGDGTNPIRFDHLGNNVTIGRNFTISANAQYYMGADNLLPSASPATSLTIPASHQNTTTLNGSISSSISLSNIATNASDAEQLFFNLTIQKTNDAVVTVTATNKSAAGDNSNALRTDNNGAFRLESGTLDQGDRSIRLLGDIFNAGNLGVFVPSVTSLDALIKVRQATLTIGTEPGAKFGNFRMNASGGVVSIDNDVTFERIQYRHGRLKIGSSNVTVNELDVDLGGAADFGNCNGCFSVEDMIITNGNASDGGLTLRITSAVNPIGGSSNNLNGNAIINSLNDDDFLFPIGIGTTGLDDGTSKYTPLLLSISDVGDVGADGEAFITVRPVNAKLATTNTTSNAIDYYWKVTTSGFDTPPTIDYLEVFGNDDDVAGADAAAKGTTLSGYVPGYVQDGGTYSRTAEATTIERGSSPAFESTDYSITFDGGGSGLFLTNLNFTAGEAAAFVGVPQIFYLRTQNNANNNFWDDGDHWSFTEGGGAAGDYPQAGDVAILTTVNNLGNGRSNIIVDRAEECAAVVFDDPNNVNGSYPRLEISNANSFAGYNSQFGVVERTDRDQGAATLLLTLGNGYTQQFPSGDFNDVLTNAGARVIIEWVSSGANTTTTLPSISNYPDLIFEGNNGGSSNQLLFPDELDITVANDVNVRQRHNVVLGSGSNFTIAGNLTLGGSASSGFDNGDLYFKGGAASASVLQIDGNLTVQTPTSNTGQSLFGIDNPTASAQNHRLIVGGNVSIGTAGAGGDIDLGSGNGAETNVILELQGNGTNTLSGSNGTTSTITIPQLIMSKGTDVANTFTISSPVSMSNISVLGDFPIEILNGTLVIDEPTFSVELANATTGDFYLPNTNNPLSNSGSGGLQINQGQVNIGGNDTGLILDGPLVLSGGDFDLSDCANNGNNFIEYSSTGQASITINNAASTLSVGSQIRRGFFSDAGILDLTISAGNLEIGACTEGDQRRAMLEIVNPFSSFIHTGGTITFLEQNGTNASATSASLLLEPATSNLTGSNIVIDLVDANDVNFSINSLIALNNLTIQSDQGGTNGNSEVVQIKTRSLTINGDLVMNDNVELRSNNLGLTLKGDFTLNDLSFYTPGLNTTTFNVEAATTNNLNGTSGSGSYYNFTKTGSGTLALGKEITVAGATFDLTAGTLSGGTNAINFTGQQLTNSAIHTSNVNTVNSGIRFNGTSGQQIMTTASNGTFGNITIDNADGVTTPDLSQEFRVENQMTLADGILDIGPALLVFGQTAELTNSLDAGTSLDDFGESNQIQSNSSIIDFGVEKEYAAGATADFVFPVGEDNRYTPTKVDFTGAGGNSGTSDGSIRIRPRNDVAPIMLSEDQATQDGVLQYHWLINEVGMDGFTANIIARYDDDVIGTDSESDYRGARAIFTDPNLAVENPFPTDNTDLVDDNTNLITYPILGENDFSGEYFAGNPLDIPDNFDAVVFDGATNSNYSEGANYFFDSDDDGVYTDPDANPATGDIRQTDLTSVVGGVIRIGNGSTLSLNQSGVQFSRLIIPSDGVLEVAGTNGHLLGQVSGTGTIRINSDGSDAVLPGGDYNTFFDCSAGGGALEYGGSGNYTILTGGISEVRALTLAGSGDKLFVNTDFNICEDLVLSGGTVEFSDGKTVTVGRDVLLNGTVASLGSAGTLEITRNLTLTSGSLTGATNGAIELSGNLTRTGATLNLIGSNATTLTLKGSTPQTITGDFSGANSIANVVVNNTTAGNAVVISGTFGVDQSMTFTDGIVLTDQTDFRTVGPTYPTPNIVSFSSSATINGGSGASFVDGVVCKESLTASTNFRFPTGDAGTFAPVQVSEDATGGSTWKARYIKRNPQSDLNTRFDNLPVETAVSTIEYWVVQTASPQTASVSLEYGSQSSVLTPNETTIVSLKDGNNNGIDTNDLWVDLGRGGLSAGADATGGTIDANLASSFSVNFYTVAGQTATALPVDLISFSAEISKKGYVQLDWSTASELDNDYFEIEYSTDGIEFETVGKIDGNGTTNLLNKYSFIHKYPIKGINYYRLRQVDFDGQFELSSMIHAILDEGNQRAIEFNIFPNPTYDSRITLAFDASSNEQILVRLVDHLGKVYFEELVTGVNGEVEVRPNTGSITPGVYYLLLDHQKGRSIKKVIFN